MQTPLQPEKILNTLLLLQSQRVNEAQQTLNIHAKNPELWSILFNFLKDQNTNSIIKISAATTLNSTLCANLDPDTYTEEETLQIIQQVYNCVETILIEPAITNQQKRNFERTIVSLLEICNQEILNKWQKLIVRLFESGDLNTGYLVIACHGVAQIHTDYLFNIVRNTYEYSLTNAPLSLDRVVQLNQLLKMWIVMFDKLLLCEQKEADFVLADMVGCSAMLKVVEWVASFYANGDTILCLHQDLFELNLLKFQAFECIHYSIYIVLQRALRFALRSDTTGSNLFEFLQTTIKKIVQTLAAVAKNPQVIQLYHCKQLVTVLIRVLVHYCRRNKTLLIESQDINKSTIHQQAFFKTYWRNLLMGIAFPLLAADQSQRESFVDNFSEFNELMEDITGDQQSETIKSQSAKLIQAICEAAVKQNSFEFTVCYAVEGLRNKLGIGSASMQEFMGSIEIETSLTILSILSYRLSQYPKCVSQLKQLISMQPKFNDFDKARFYQFLAYNYPQLYENPREGQNLVIQALREASHPTTTLSALDFVSNLAQDFYSDDFFKLLSDKIITTKENLIWTIISATIHNKFSEITEPALVYLCNRIFKRIDMEMQQIMNNSKRQKLSLINAFHILRKILQLSKNRSTTEGQGNLVLTQIIWNITNYIGLASKLQVEQQIISIVNQFLNQNQKIVHSDPFLDLISQIIKSFENQKYLGTPYFILFNNFIMNAELVTIWPVVKVLMAGFDYHINISQNIKKSKQKVVIAHHIMLFQNFLAIHGTSIKDQNVFDSFLKIASKTFPTEEGKVLDKIVLSRGINLTFICYMHVKKQEIFALVKKFHSLKCYQGYDSKVMTQCIERQILQNETDPTVITQLLSIMVKITRQAVNAKQKKLKESKKLKSKSKALNVQKKKLTSERPENYEFILHNIKVPFDKTTSQVKRLNNLLNTMKSSNPQMYEALLEKMESSAKQSLSQLMKIESTNESGRQRKILKVSGIKGIKQEGQQQIDKKERFEEEENPNEQQEAQSYKRMRLKQKQNKKLK